MHVTVSPAQVTENYSDTRQDRADRWQTRLAIAVVSLTLIALAGCASKPSDEAKAPEPAPAVVSLDEWMAQAKAALAEGNHEKARAAYRSAAQTYPTEKTPWLRLSEDFFTAHDYGNAVLASQEALQRDPRDNLANSILAVSGLRITANSLMALRQDASFPVGSRDEALAVTRSLREALGEPSLLPQSPSPASTRRPVRRTASSSTANGPAPVKAASATNPLDKLK